MDILDGTIAEIKAATISPTEARELLASEEAGKTRKGVIAHLKGVIAADTITSDTPYGDGLLRVTEAGAGKVHDGDGGLCSVGDVLEVPADVADALIAQGLARHA